MKKKPVIQKSFRWNDEKIFVCDFETTTNNCKWYKQAIENPNGEHVRLTYWYMKNLKGTQDYQGTSMETFIKQIKSFKGAHIQLYFHNLAFDGDFIFSFLCKYNPNNCVGISYGEPYYFIDGYEKVEEETYSWFRLKNKWYDIFQTGSRIMNIRMGNHDGKHYQLISISCSLRLLSSSVAALGKSYGIPKMTKEDKAKGNSFYDVEPNDNLEQFIVENKNYVEYCKRDVESVRLALNDFKKTIDDLPFVKEKNFENDRKGVNIAQYTTISSLGRDLMENVFVKGFQHGYKMKQNQDGTFQVLTKPNGKPLIDVEQVKKWSMKNYQHVEIDGTIHKIPYGNMVKINNYTHNQFDVDFHYIDENGNLNNDVKDRYYKGGLTQYNPHFYEWNDVGRSCKLDVSSAYPYHMTKPLPFGCWINEHDFWNNHYKDGWKEGIDYIEFVKVHVKKCIPNEMNKHCCVIPNWTNAKVSGTNKLYRKNPNIQENFIVCTTREEWDEFQHWATFEIEQEPNADGKLVDKIEKNYMYAAPYLEPISRVLYSLKDYYSKNKDNGRKQCIKICLNALYGSLAIRNDYENIYYTKKEIASKIQDENEILAINSKWNNEKLFEFKGYSPSRDYYNKVAIKLNYEKQKRDGFNKAAGCVITSRERVYLMKTIRQIGAKNFGYCDTDSILFVNLSKQQLKQLVDLSKSKSGLGAWEFEENYIVRFKGVGAKKYRTTSIPCDIDENGNDTFYNFDENNNKIYFDNVDDALKYAQEHNKFSKSSKIGGITQQDNNDSIFDFDFEDLKDKQTFLKTMMNIWEQQDMVFKENNELTIELLDEWYNNYVNKGEIPIIAGSRTSIRVNGGRLLITANKILKLNKNFT